MTNEVEVVITSKDKSGPGFDSGRRRVKEIGDEADRSGSKMHAFGTVAVNASGKLRASLGLASLGWAGAAVGLVAGFKSVMAEATESVKTSAQTTAAIKSTGGAAHVTADQVGDLATAISNKVGVDDEAIQSGENLLLTFTNIRNETGKGNDVFNQASRAVVDMTAALNNGEVTTEGLKASSIQLGKALNDPLKGISALQRVGVTFSEEQKKQIALFVKHGQTAKAQGVILKEVNREFGGSAAAATTPMQKLGVVINNVKETIGLKLLPTVNTIANWLSKNLPTALQAAQTWWDNNQTSIKNVVRTLGDLAKAFADIIGWIFGAIGWIDKLISKMDEANAVASGFKAGISPIFGFMPRFEHGGIVGAASGALRSNLVEVGEHGRELLSLPPGTQVHSNPDTERMLAGAGGPTTVVIEIQPGGSGLDKLFVEWLRNAVRVKGGNVQTVLGR